MQNSVNTYDSEIKNLLRDYFAEDDFKKLIFDSNHLVSTDSVTAQISGLYKKQLDIKMEDTCNRMQIDRAITFAEKRLESDKYFEFILKLGEICNDAGKYYLAQEIFNKINRRTKNKTLKAKSLIGLADISSRKANWTRSISLVSEAESIFKETNDKAGISNCFNMLGSISGEMGDIEKAKTYFNQSLFFANDADEKTLYAKIEVNLGVVNSILGNTDEAVEHLEISLNLYKELKDLKKVSELYHNIGINFLQTGDTKSALAAFDKGIDIAVDNQYWGSLALLYLAKSQVLIENQDIRMAKEFADKALSISHNLDDKLTIADIYRVRGLIAKKLNDTQTAKSYLMISLRINTKQRNSLNIAEASAELASIYKEEGKDELGNNYLNQALDYYRKTNVKEKVLMIEKMLGLETVQSNATEVQNEQ
jgi:tetratricopeptide (TPR) repeat protein